MALHAGIHGGHGVRVCSLVVPTPTATLGTADHHVAGARTRRGKGGNGQGDEGAKCGHVTSWRVVGPVRTREIRYVARAASGIPSRSLAFLHDDPCREANQDDQQDGNPVAAVPDHPAATTHAAVHHVSGLRQRGTSEQRGTVAAAVASKFFINDPVQLDKSSPAWALLTRPPIGALLQHGDTNWAVERETGGCRNENQEGQTTPTQCSGLCDKAHRQSGPAAVKNLSGLWTCTLLSTTTESVPESDTSVGRQHGFSVRAPPGPLETNGTVLTRTETVDGATVPGDPPASPTRHLLSTGDHEANPVSSRRAIHRHHRFDSPYCLGSSRPGRSSSHAIELIFHPVGVRTN